jgi:hypothetical protein
MQRESLSGHAPENKLGTMIASVARRVPSATSIGTAPASTVWIPSWNDPTTGTTGQDAANSMESASRSREDASRSREDALRDREDALRDREGVAF